MLYRTITIGCTLCVESVDLLLNVKHKENSVDPVRCKASNCTTPIKQR